MIGHKRETKTEKKTEKSDTCSARWMDKGRKKTRDKERAQWKMWDGEKSSESWTGQEGRVEQ